MREMRAAFAPTRTTKWMVGGKPQLRHALFGADVYIRNSKPCGHRD
jgi:hypothetical protein